jgi:hypothetical protein
MEKKEKKTEFFNMIQNFMNYLTDVCSGEAFLVGAPCIWRRSWLEPSGKGGGLCYFDMGDCCFV